MQVILGQKSRLAIVVLFTLGMFLVAGCGSGGLKVSGKKFGAPEVNTIQKGKTTKQEIRTTFGEPAKTWPTATGETWRYGYHTVGILNENQDMDVDFDKNGVVTDYRYQGGKSF